MNLVSEVASYVISVVLQASLVTLAFVLTSIAVYLLCRKLGLTRISQNDLGIVKFLKVASVVVVALIFGSTTGFQLAVTGISMEVLGDHGPVILSQSMEHAAKPLGFGVNDPVDMSRARQLIQNTQAVTLVEGGGMSGTLINKAFDQLKGPLVSEADKYIATLAPSDLVTPNDIATAIWDATYAKLLLSNSHLQKTILLTAMVWMFMLFAVGMSSLAMCRVVVKRKTALAAR